ncbi:protein POLR1D-like [Megalops cyprinoides]|uniref:protein POLR1D-like n=1 Tax=Megalops cyprinoides TaxID=118141 RepID=UPI001863D213|nr:protein POLR1D-like [Megalops cyprinoides]
MADDRDLERRAVEELLSEATRARIRAETMGPAGWVKCPLRSTNKRFLLNTLRTTTLQRRPAGRTEPQQSQAGGPRPSDRTSSSNYRRGCSRSPIRTLPPDQSPPSSKHAHRQSDHRDRQTHRQSNHGDKHRQSNHGDGCTHRQSDHSDRHTHTDRVKTSTNTHRTAESPTSWKTHK